MGACAVRREWDGTVLGAEKWPRE
jgi:hypothetical protein